jgi:hypothetical protein
MSAGAEDILPLSAYVVILVGICKTCRKKRSISTGKNANRKIVEGKIKWLSTPSRPSKRRKKYL